MQQPKPDPRPENIRSPQKSAAVIRAKYRPHVMRRILVGGIPGVGKDTVMRELKSIIGSEPAYINFADLMLAAASQEFDRNELQDLSTPDKRRLRQIVFTKIEDKPHVLVNGHYSLVREDTATGALSFEIAFDTCFSHIFSSFVCLTAPPKEILARRLSDNSRERITDYGIIRLEAAVEKAFGDYVSLGKLILVPNISSPKDCALKIAQLV